jgi:hypothetical protein
VIHYVVIAGTPAAINRVAPTLLPALDETRVFSGDRIEYSTGSWSVAALSAPDPLSPSRFTATGDEMMVLNGPAVANSGHEQPLCEYALERLRRGGARAVFDAVHGTYNFVGVTRETGLRAVADFSAFYPLYWGQGADFGVFSNRSTTVARVLGSAQWDLRALSWIIGHSSLWGDALPQRDVTYLVPGQEARVDAHGRVHAETATDSLWPEFGRGELRSELDASDWDEITESLVGNFRALDHVREPLTLFMTGGKDSRLCLALAKAAGLQHRLTAVTTGGPDSPEVEVARRVAEALGIAYQRKGVPARAQTAAPASRPFDAEAIWRRLRRHSYRHEAIVCPWDGTVDAGSTTLNIKGFGGEIYRGPGGHAQQFRQEAEIGLDEMAERFVRFHQRPDPLGVLTPDTGEWQASWLRGWVYENARRVRLDALPEKFYLDYRVGHWNGPMCQATPGRIKVMPLMSRVAMKRNFELSAAARNDEHLHFEVMRRTAPELMSIPFLNSTWSERLRANGIGQVARVEYPTKVKASTRVLRSWQWLFLASEGKAIDGLLKRAKREGLGEICDMKILRKIARDSESITGVLQAKTVVSAVGVALALVGETEAVEDPVGVE